PELVLARQVAQRLEGDGRFDGVAVVGYHALRLHDNVHTVVLVPALGQDAVLLHPQRVEDEDVRLTLVVVGVEQDAHVIVVRHVVAFGDRGAHLAGLVVRAKGYVEKFVVIAEKHLGRLRRGDVVAWLYLVEVSEKQSMLPHFVVETTINDRRLLEARGHLRAGLLQRRGDGHVGSGGSCPRRPRLGGRCRGRCHGRRRPRRCR